MICIHRRRQMIQMALFLVCFTLASIASGFGPFAVTPVRVIDGDTIVIDVALWPDLTQRVSLRLAGVDTPELHASVDCERILALKAKQFTEQWIGLHQNFTVPSLKPDKYAGRADGRLLSGTGDLAAELIAAGLGRPYAGGARQPWCAP